MSQRYKKINSIGSYAYIHVTHTCIHIYVNNYTAYMYVYIIFAYTIVFLCSQLPCVTHSVSRKTFGRPEGVSGRRLKPLDSERKDVGEAGREPPKPPGLRDSADSGRGPESWFIGALEGLSKCGGVYIRTVDGSDQVSNCQNFW